MRMVPFLKIPKIQFKFYYYTLVIVKFLSSSHYLKLLGIPSSHLAGCVMEVVGINPSRPPNCFHVIRLIKPIERKRILPQVDYYLDLEYL